MLQNALQSYFYLTLQAVRVEESVVEILNTFLDLLSSYKVSNSKLYLQHLEHDE